MFCYLFIPLLKSVCIQIFWSFQQKLNVEVPEGFQPAPFIVACHRCGSTSGVLHFHPLAMIASSWLMLWTPRRWWAMIDPWVRAPSWPWTSAFWCWVTGRRDGSLWGDGHWSLTRISSCNSIIVTVNGDRRMILLLVLWDMNTDSMSFRVFLLSQHFQPIFEGGGLSNILKLWHWCFAFTVGWGRHNQNSGCYCPEIFLWVAY